MTRVLLILTARDVGGAELYVERLVEALTAECTFTVAIADHSNMQNLRASLSRFARVLVFPFDHAFQLVAVVRDLQRLAALHDVVHINSNHPASRLGILLGFALGGKRVPVVCVEHRVTPVTDVRIPRAIVWALPTLFRWSRRGVSRVIAVSQDNARMLIDHYRLPASRVQAVYNGVDIDLYLQPQKMTPGNLRRELRLSENQPIILVLAHLSPQKGHRFLVQAAPAILSRFPEAHFVFAGKPDGREELDRQIAELNLADRFSILGFRADTIDLLRDSQVFVLPSLAEGFSLSIIEALAAGLPVVATRVGGAEEVLDEGQNGFLVPPSDADALARAVIWALSLSGSEKERMREVALDTARRFSSQETARLTLGVYNQVLLEKCQNPA